MKISFLIPKIYKKVKSVFAPKDKFYTDGAPCQKYFNGVRARYYTDGKVASYKTEHEYIRFGYTETGDRFVKEYKSEPKMFFRGKHKKLFDKYFLDSKTDKNSSQ